MTEPRPRPQPLEGGAPAPREPADPGWGNLSGAERVVRSLAGAAMLAAAWSGAVSGIAGVALQVFGWVPLATGVAGWCPFYAIAGFSTRPRRPHRRAPRAH
ncbi:MAG: DUF2892 domain-containing protein [Acidobacteria bacterium]|nr:DUF2892 domain-containing protein [Acidobacteriota bacterium]